ncbi:MAG: amidase [Thermomicrobiales bacterium]
MTDPISDGQGLIHQLATLTIRDAMTMLDARAISAVELIAATIARMEVTEHGIHAYVHVLANEARQQALEADRHRVTQRRTRPLLGIPLGVKDLYDVAGLTTFANSAQRRNAPPAIRDADAVAHLRAAGGIVVGTTVTQEYAAGVVSAPARNPWDTDRIPGGSSGGSAASVAIGSCLGALGSDTGGSIRTPAALCGVVGLKPTWGRISTNGVYPLAPSLDTAGPIARSVPDVLTLYLALADRVAEIDAVDEMLAPFGPVGLEGVRIGVLGGFFTDDTNPDVIASMDNAVEDLRRLGAEIVELDWDGAAAARAVGAVVNRVESGTVHHTHLRVDPDLMGQDARMRFEAGQIIPGSRYLRAKLARQVLRDDIARIYREHHLDAVVAPTTPAVAPDAETLQVEVPSGMEGVGTAFTRLTIPWNTTGQPAITVPCGADRDGMPIGISFVGKPDEEVALCRIAAQYERATGWFRTAVIAAG